ncbi:GNAT family N-acetyltransferase [Paenarthrobacter nitroguajacolicus]|uniref:GNAT family N-acetyltransferase n=1 Tax=Paenarthrobacter nitroguajacolicus TaxID=211146 RepID=UPI000A48B087|nr:GNAT family N-acetyltransferase [Paenarthrobacter nitroguajacolicus]
MSQIISDHSNPVLDSTSTARQSAMRAASLANVAIRPLKHLDDFIACEALFDSIWRPESGSSLMAKDLLRGISSANSYVAGAFQTGQLVGACVGFWGPPESRSMHSHIAGVSGNARGRNVGYALKLDQRAHALESQVETITWTFDPLVRRNAFFNFHKLGGMASKYLVNYYGPMLDDINGSDESDRLLLEWDLASPGVVRRCDATSGTSTPQMAERNGVPALTTGSAGQPLFAETDASKLLVGVPEDIENLRHLDPGLGREWRTAVREVLTSFLSRGGYIEGFDPQTGSYIVTKGK